MSTETEVILARYRQVEREADGLGRVIGVRRLRPSEQTKLHGMTPEMAGVDEVPEFKDVEGSNPPIREPTGRTMPVSRRLPLLIAASVCEINELRIPFPKTRGELDSIIDRLDAEGLEAAGKAYLRLIETYSPPRSEEEAKEEAKNS